MGDAEYLQVKNVSDKADQKRNYILEKAREVFAEKGFAAVTMKDIVEACDISRGGLYLYFDSTAAVFEAILSEEQNEEDSFGEGIPKKATAADVLALFLKEQKKELLSKRPSLTRAVYEYHFQNKIPAKDNYCKKQFDIALYIVEQLVTEGVASGELVCEDPKGCACNMIYVLEGLRIAAKTRPLTEKAVDSAILYIMKGLVPEEF